MTEEILRYIITYTRSRGYPPTMKEIADHTGVTVSRVFWYLERMQVRGLVTRVPRQPRTVVVTVKGKELVLLSG
jgi:repressor LexA